MKLGNKDAVETKGRPKQECADGDVKSKVGRVLIWLMSAEVM
jgi:hypothetical protein